VSRKMVVRVEDLVEWACAESAGWRSSLKPPPCGTNGLHKPLQSSVGNGSGGNNNSSDGNNDSSNNNNSSDPLKDKTQSKNITETCPEALQLLANMCGSSLPIT